MRIEAVKCDRCGKFCDDEQPTAVMYGGATCDLCDACEADLGRFLQGAKLQRKRTPAEPTT